MLALLLLLAAVAPAQDNAPGGFRSSPQLPVRSAALRPALVLESEWADVAQLTFDGRIYSDPWSLQLQSPVVVAWRPDGSWSDVGLGLVRLGAMRAVGKKPHWIGGELFLPITPPGMAARSWASLAQETLFGLGGRIGYERLWALPSPITLRVAAGAHCWSDQVLPSWASSSAAVQPSAELVAARSWLIRPGWAVVTEGELALDAVPVTLRVMGRRVQPVERGALVADLGLQIPPLTWVDYFSFQLLGQLRWYPEGIVQQRPRAEEEPNGAAPHSPR